MHPNILGRMTPDPQQQARTTTSAERRSVVVPDKPALEGLEEKWVERLEGRRDLHASTAPSPRDDVYSIDTPPPTVSGSPARRARLLLHPHRPDRALPADARQGGLLPDGLGRQRPADRAPGAELLRRPLRPVAALRPRLHPAGEARPEAPGADQPAQLRRAVRAARRWRTRRSSRGSGARWGSRSTGTSTTRRSGRSRSWSARRAFLRNFARGEAYLADAPTAVGRDVPDGGGAGRDGGARLRRPLPPGGLPPARRRRRSTSRRPAPS